MSLAGRTIPHYTIVEEISGGGMGMVYRRRVVRLDHVQEAMRELQ